MGDVRYVPWGTTGDSASYEWAVFLTLAHRDGWPGGLNEGHRTFARQAFFWNNQPPLAAFPSHNAPHIRTGRFDHAIDVNGSDWLIAYGRRHGIILARTVRGEVWHLEVQNPAALREFAVKHGHKMSRSKYPTLRPGAVGMAVTRLQRHLRAAGVHRVPRTGKYGRPTRQAVKRFQRSHGLRPDGVCGPKTWRKLRAEARRRARRQAQKG